MSNFGFTPNHAPLNISVYIIAMFKLGIATLSGLVSLHLQST